MPKTEDKKFKLDPNHKEAWIQALLSGRYQQGKSELVQRLPNEKSTHCCLGVFGAELGCLSRGSTDDAAEGKTIRRWKNRTGDKDLDDAVAGFLPYKLIPQEVQAALANKNDNGASFEQIADYIKKNL